MESSFAPLSPATPLQSVSPDRINRQPDLRSPCSPIRTPIQSPHLKEDPFFSRSHRNSDVQGKVLQFNQLAESLTPKRKDNEAALRRAVLGREEAEARMRRLEEENESLQSSLEESSGRELKVAQRIETMMEEVQRHKEAGQRANAVYEKEIRRARKEAFKSSSALVKLQEDLKNARNRYTLMREECEDQKRKLEMKEEEAFSAQYKLVEKQEELEQLQQRLKLVEQERDTLRTNLKEEEVARIAAEGKIPLPPSTPNDEFSSPKKSSVRTPTHVHYGFAKGNAEPISSNSPDSHIDKLQRELLIERRRYHEIEGLVNFMKLECQLKACSCRRAERSGASYIYDTTLLDLYTDMAPSSGQNPPVYAEVEESVTPVEESVIVRRSQTSVEPETLIEFSPGTGTFRKSKSPTKAMISISATMEAKSPNETTQEVELAILPTVNSLSEPLLSPTEASDPSFNMSLPGHPSNNGSAIDLPPAKDARESTVTPLSPSSSNVQLPVRPQSRVHSSADTRVEARASIRSQSRVGVRDSIRSQSRVGTRDSVRGQSRAGVRDSVRSESRAATRESIRSQSRIGARAESRTRPRDSSRAPSRHSGPKTSASTRAASPPRQQHRGPTMRVVEKSQTVKIPLADPDTPSSPKAAEKPRMPFTPGGAASAREGDEEELNKLPFTPGATKTREEALQSIRRWREGNSRATNQEGTSKVRSRSVTHTGGATPRRASPVRRDITK